MTHAPRIPSLTLPFGALGALTGWISVSALQNPLFRAGPELHRSIAAAGGGLTAALIGAYLTRWLHAQVSQYDSAHSDWYAMGRWLRLGPPLVVGGALTGALVGAFAQAPWDGIRLGLVCALCAVPLCAVVLRASLRAGRARLGSLVADTDRREVWAVLVLVASCETLAELPGGPAWATVGLPGPWVSVAVALGGVPLVLGLLRRDLAARRRLTAESRDLRAREREHAPPSEIPRLDLGIGDELSARHAQGSSAYRDHEREVALVIGNLDEARSALDKAVRRGAVSLSIMGLVVAGHVVSLGPWLRLPFAAALCDRRDLAGCVAEARLLEANDPTDARIGPLYVRVCDAHHQAPCEMLVDWFAANPALARDEAAVRALGDACSTGHGEACASLAGVAEQTGNVQRAQALRQRACRHGHSPSCGSAGW
jgi:hypothetical protein